MTAVVVTDVAQGSDEWVRCPVCSERFRPRRRKDRPQRFCSRACGVAGRPSKVGVPMKAVPSYRACHIRVYQSRGKASDHPCVECGRTAQQWSFNMTWPGHIDQTGRPYSHRASDYDPMCIRCHRIRDITRCKWGHSLVGDNLYVSPQTGYRQCRVCSKERRQRRKDVEA